LRIFEDAKGKMNHSVSDVGGELLIVSKFTLYGDCSHGRRPNFTAAESPPRAEELFEAFIGECRELGLTVKTGSFGADMKVELTNDGPVTIIMDTEEMRKNDGKKEQDKCRY
ncbi:MAG: D-aminoacyl-tRNA deacylase, partial [Bacillota bacterium]|nr:D-aminoacyl-tRNA deacylase [Bacillota bacterium]